MQLRPKETPSDLSYLLLGEIHKGSEGQKYTEIHGDDLLRRQGST